jgi:ATP-dependent RNA helicase DeaD
VKPGSIVAAIAREAALNGRDIGHIDIYTEYSTVELPKGMPEEIFQALRETTVAGQALRISRLDTAGTRPKSRNKTKAKRKKERRAQRKS